MAKPKFCSLLDHHTIWKNHLLAISAKSWMWCLSIKRKYFSLLTKATYSIFIRWPPASLLCWVHLIVAYLTRSSRFILHVKWNWKKWHYHEQKRHCVCHDMTLCFSCYTVFVMWRLSWCDMFVFIWRCVFIMWRLCVSQEMCLSWCVSVFVIWR